MVSAVVWGRGGQPNVVSSGFAQLWWGGDSQGQALSVPFALQTSPYSGLSSTRSPGEAEVPGPGSDWEDAIVQARAPLSCSVPPALSLSL